ncbi:MAG: sn-glycerol-3-phosphate ABC transporter ATP-binding protein UgpC [Rhizobiaceae bacterium]|nr:sn-glycerol-3-phosphate ABC transporter ATP-binding protein UgpC [Rhizobiaceae bacterium]
MSSINVMDVAKFYGSQQVLFDVNVSIEHGEFVVLVGPSGCGKSTLLRMIAGLESVSGGEILLGDELINDVSPQKRDVAMVFQTYALYPHMTVEENILFALKMRNQSPQRCEVALKEVSEILGLGDLLDRYPKQLSGGQRQRVAMGRAIVRNPQAFLFDEPLSNLDAKLRSHMRTEIRGLHQRLGTTSVYVTHDQVEAMTMADRIVVMNGGRIEQIGTPIELYDNPANKFVAGFLGSPTMNFVDGELRVDGNDAIFVSHQEKKFQVGAHANMGDLDKRRATIGIRPQSITLTPVDSQDDELVGHVRVVEQTGSETISVVDFLDSEIIVQSPRRQLLHPDQAVRVEFDMAAAHMFDAQNGLRLN